MTARTHIRLHTQIISAENLEESELRHWHMVVALVLPHKPS